MKLKTKCFQLCLALSLGLTALPTQATVDLKEYGFNVDGTYTSNAAPPGVNLGAFDTGSGLGTITATITGIGAHFFGGFFDHELSQGINTPFNETGFAVGTAAAGQSWEIDEPGFGICPSNNCPPDPFDYQGDIFVNINDSDPTINYLDNLIFYDWFANQTYTPPDDVSMAMGWLFDLLVDEIARITLVISTDVNDMIGSLYLEQRDVDTGEQLFLSGSLNISTVAVPEPSMLLLLALGQLALLGILRARQV
ncbi:MAG: PEP-CTERM sorting domain-containing protein [Chromatiaceae bacterium]|nr:PEP-CTERM sorting domain-containing protein [Chromatiaceae bacterium]